MTTHTMRCRRRLALAVLMASTAMAAGGGAWAQTEPQAAPATAAQATMAQTPDGDELVVTAQKREERLLDTPLSVSAVTGQTLQSLGATQLRDFATMIPSLNFTTSGPGQTQVNLRGVTTGQNISPTVGIYVDEVPYGSSTAFAAGAQLALDVGLFDVSRVEVLRGPQGTLYGASTMGGLLKYVTVAPDPGAYSGMARAGVSGTHHGGVNYDAAAAINAPLGSDKAALRVSGFYNRDGGYVDNLSLKDDDVNQAEIYGLRGDVLLKPTDQLSVRLTAFGQNISRDGSSAVGIGRTSEKPADGGLDQRQLLPEPFDQRFRLVSGVATYDAGPVTVTSVTSYQTVHSEGATDVSALYVPYLAGAGLTLGSTEVYKAAQTKKFTEELRLNGAVDRLDWLVGGFYTHEDSSQHQALRPFDPAGAAFPLNLLTVDLPSTYREYAAFGNLTYRLTDKFDVSGGVRYAHNDQAETQNGSGLLIGSLPRQKSSDNVATWLANVRYRPTRNLMGYLRFATGYRPGGPNLVATDLSGQPLAPPTFGADKLRSYEAGLKATTSDHRFSIDADVFLIDWDNMQVLAVRNGIGVVANANTARNKGAEVTVTALPIPDLKIVGAFSVIDAKLSKDAADLGGLDGDRLPDTPKFTAAISADYSFDLAGQRPFVGGTFRHVSDRVSSFDLSSGSPQYHLPDYSIVDLRTGVDLKDTRVQLYVRNLFDSRGQQSATTAFSLFSNVAQVSIIQPRTVGVSVSRQF